jgi:uncharacterized phiE125 gp8 family phage protein
MMPLLTRISDPAVLPVDKSWVKFQAYIDYDGDDELLDLYIESAVDRLDGPNGLLNRALITQTWMAQYEAFPAEIRIPLPRLQSVSSITYLDASGSSQALPLDRFTVSGVGTDHARIKPVDGWPTTAKVDGAVTVIFLSGFGNEPEDVPAIIRHAILEMVSNAYENRASVGVDITAMTIPQTAMNAVTAWTVWAP